jgi:hypothetical protein
LKGADFDVRAKVAEVTEILSQSEHQQLLTFLSTNFKIRRQGGEIVLLGPNDDSDSDNNAHRH